MSTTRNIPKANTNTEGHWFGSIKHDDQSPPPTDIPLPRRHPLHLDTYAAFLKLILDTGIRYEEALNLMKKEIHKDESKKAIDSYRFHVHRHSEQAMQYAFTWKRLSGSEELINLWKTTVKNLENNS